MVNYIHVLTQQLLSQGKETFNEYTTTYTASRLNTEELIDLGHFVSLNEGDLVFVVKLLVNNRVRGMHECITRQRVFKHTLCICPNI